MISTNGVYGACRERGPLTRNSLLRISGEGSAANGSREPLRLSLKAKINPGMPESAQPPDETTSTYPRLFGRPYTDRNHRRADEIRHLSPAAGQGGGFHPPYDPPLNRSLRLMKNCAVYGTTSQPRRRPDSRAACDSVRNPSRRFPRIRSGGNRPQSQGPCGALEDRQFSNRAVRGRCALGATGRSSARRTARFSANPGRANRAVRAAKPANMRASKNRLFREPRGFRPPEGARHD